MRALAASVAALSILWSGSIFAQTDSAAPRTTTTPAAVSNPNDTAKTTAAPVAGKNSFTSGEVTRRLNDHGYAQVSNLSQDAQSVWHATATKAGQQVTVAVDYQGNITEQR